MPKITYVSEDGAKQAFDVPIGLSVMRGASLNDVDGIESQCGGYAQCGTCHVYVDPRTAGGLNAMEADEDNMLGYTVCERRGNSRLSCQLPVTDALDGLVVHLPGRQAP
jgi:ferredoxin, 2Fe-2S